MRVIRDTWRMLGRSIFVGERYEKNLKSIAKMSLIMSLAGLVMFVMNLASGAYLVSLTSIAFMFTGVVCYYLTAVFARRRMAMVVTVIAVISVLTYNVLFVSNGFAFLWTILVPLCISYLFSVRAGIIVSAYFSLLFTVLFYSPLRETVRESYPQIILDRFPILYIFLFVTTTFVMIQYHKSVLDQIDKAEQLQKAKEAADRANQAKSDFLAEMSHEIRTPINAVLGMNEMIRRESDRGRTEASGEEQEAAFRNISTYAGNIEDAGNNLLSIINDILDFSKIEAGRLELIGNAYELSLLLSDVSNLISFRAKEKGLDYLLDVDERIPEVLFGDKVRVRQIITNLLTNAFKYTDRGSILLKVRCLEDEFRAGDTVRLQITVKDTGIGIRQEDIRKLFIQFQRVDLDRNSTVEGTGLGLAITHRLLTMMGGSISVESVYGEGSAFTVVLPQQVVSAEPVGNVQAGDLQPGRGGRAYQESFRAPEARILVVDDTQINLSVVTGLLKKTELQIDTALNGEEALGLLEHTAYDAVLMDQRMPGMDGAEVLQRLRGMEGSPSREAPVICLTADAIIGAKEKYTALGFTDYLPKPAGGEVLEKTLVRHLPREKVEIIWQEETPEEAARGTGQETAGGEWYALLRAAGIDPDTGMHYCQQDEKLYRSLLREYVRGADEKARDMRACIEAQDWKQYGVLVHALKSTSRTIGAAALADRAAALEEAANGEDTTFIRDEHPALADRYLALAGALREAVGAGDGTGDPEDGILEFEPQA